MHRIWIEEEGGALIVSAAGELDAYTAPELGETFKGVVEDGHRRLIADLTRATFMDSSALGLLVKTVREFEETGGRVRVVLPQSAARRIFEITTLDRVLPVSPSRAVAVAEVLSEGERLGDG